jgi:hypothetical protein
MKTNFVIVSDNLKVTRVTSVVVFQLTGNRPTRKVNREKWRLLKKKEMRMLYSSALTVIIWRCNPASIYTETTNSQWITWFYVCLRMCYNRTHTHVLDGSRSRSPDSPAKKERKNSKGWINLWYPCFIHSFSLSSRLVGGCHNKYYNKGGPALVDLMHLLYSFFFRQELAVKILTRHSFFISTFHDDTITVTAALW